MRSYDAVAVLGGGLYKDGDRFLPATYKHSDEFGMLGGEIRLAAAVSMYSMLGCATFLFCGGTSAKQKAVFGNEAPIEAVVYRDTFLGEITELRPPVTLLDRETKNTAGNMRKIRSLASLHRWQSVAVVSNDYHVPRVEAWWNATRSAEADPSELTVDFLSAENIVLRAFPGIYDIAIREAYQSPEGLKRLQNEANGLADLQADRLVHGEFQLEPQR